MFQLVCCNKQIDIRKAIRSQEKANLDGNEDGVLVGFDDGKEVGSPVGVDVGEALGVLNFDFNYN